MGEKFVEVLDGIPDRCVLPIIGVTKVRHVEDAAKAAGVTLSVEEIAHLEALADKANVNTIREWEKKMD